MTKQLNIDPQDMRRPGFIEFDPIPVNQYRRTIEDEKVRFSTDDFLRIYRDMRFIREFESMLYTIKTTNAYNGIGYNNPGPAHLSMGQEASAVGQAYLLSTDDFISFMWPVRSSWSASPTKMQAAFPDSRSARFES